MPPTMNNSPRPRYSAVLTPVFASVPPDGAREELWAPTLADVVVWPEDVGAEDVVRAEDDGAEDVDGTDEDPDGAADAALLSAIVATNAAEASSTTTVFVRKRERTPTKEVDMTEPPDSGGTEKEVLPPTHHRRVYRIRGDFALGANRAFQDPVTA